MFGTVAFSLLLNAFEVIFEDITVVTDDKLLASIYGGLLVGIGTAIVLRNNASTGGTDLLSNILSKYFPTFKTGSLIVLLDTIIVGANMIALKQIEIGLYSAIAIYIDGKIIEIIAEGTNYTKMIFIVSDKYEEIANSISEQLKRGSTAIYATGMYRKEEKKILWCVASRNQIVRIRQIAKSIDKNSFMTIFNAREAYGLGFK